MGGHSESVHACISPARAVNSFHARKQFAQRFFNPLLNSDPRTLNLPAGVIRAVVSDDEFDLDRFHDSIQGRSVLLRIAQSYPDNFAAKLRLLPCPPFLSAADGGHPPGSKAGWPGQR